MSDEPIFEIHEMDADGKLTSAVVRIFANGQVTGLVGEAMIVNRIPAILRGLGE